MIEEYFFHPPAKREFGKAVQRYREESVSVSRRFFDEVDAAVQMLMESPGMGRPTGRGARVKVLSGFPYSIVYRVAGEALQILAVAHHRRRPDYWVKRAG